MREAHLRLLAGETGLSFLHLQEARALAAALTAPALARPVPARADLRWLLAAGALLLLLARHWPARGTWPAIGRGRWPWRAVQDPR